MSAVRKKVVETQNDLFIDDLYLGIDIGGSNMKYGIIDHKGNVVFQRSHSTNANKGLDYMLASLKNLILNLQAKYPKIKAIGVGVPGLVLEDGTVKLAPNLPEWEDVPLGKFLTNVFSLPVAIDNDANAAAYGEMIMGAGKDLNSFIYITLGTGVGGAIVLDRKIFRGEHGCAGEFGHIIFNPFAEVVSAKPFRSGILEEYLGKNQIGQYAKKYIKDKPNTLLHTYPKTDPFFISDAVEKGDEVAVEIFNYVGQILGLGLTTVMNFLDISCAIVGGGVALSPDCFLQSAEATVRQRALPHIAESVKIVRAELIKDTVFVGAALLARDFGK